MTRLYAPKSKTPWEDEDSPVAKPAKPMMEPANQPAAPVEKNPKAAQTSGSPKLSVTIRLDQDIVDHFKAGGRFWQTRINDALRGLLDSGTK